MTSLSIKWSEQMPDKEGIYLMEERSGRITRVEISKMDNINEKEGTDHLFVIEEPTMYYPLIEENNCHECRWLYESSIANRFKR